MDSEKIQDMVYPGTRTKEIKHPLHDIYKLLDQWLQDDIITSSQYSVYNSLIETAYSIGRNEVEK